MQPPNRQFSEPRDQSGWTGHGQTAWRGYKGLRRRSQDNSLSWWWLKIIQGMVWGGGLLAAGLASVIASRMMDTARCFFLGGTGAIVGGIIILLLYILAPVSRRWIVYVPENWYYVVEDHNRYTLAYLEPGRIKLDWHWNASVRPYVNFNSVAVRKVMHNALDSRSLPVDIEIAVSMAFNPTLAEPRLYPKLRKMDTQEPFQMIISGDIENVVFKHLNKLAPVQGQQGMLHNAESLEALILERLEGLEALGLTPSGAHPVRVFVRAPQQVQDAYQTHWARAARVREESQALLEIKELARELNMSFEDAFRLFYIMQYGTSPTPAPTPSAVPPVYVFQQPPVDVPTRPVQIIGPESTTPPTELPKTGPIQNSEDAPDPLEARRRRRKDR
jgi:hypothetical protein